MRPVYLSFMRLNSIISGTQPEETLNASDNSVPKPPTSPIPSHSIALAGPPEVPSSSVVAKTVLNNTMQIENSPCAFNEATSSNSERIKRLRTNFFCNLATCELSSADLPFKQPSEISSDASNSELHNDIREVEMTHVISKAYSNPTAQCETSGKNNNRQSVEWNEEMSNFPSTLCTFSGIVKPSVVTRVEATHRTIPNQSKLSYVNESHAIGEERNKVHSISDLVRNRKDKSSETHVSANDVAEERSSADNIIHSLKTIGKSLYLMDRSGTSDEGPYANDAVS